MPSWVRLCRGGGDRADADAVDQGGDMQRTGTIRSGGRRAALKACEYPHELVFCTWALVELVEAASRSGQPGLASDAPEQLAETRRARAPCSATAMLRKYSTVRRSTSSGRQVPALSSPEPACCTANGCAASD